jgi:hypothetical protein
MAFRAHMNSAAHAPRIFHCPLIFLRGDALSKASRKMKYFKTLGGLAQHLETGARQGGLETFKRAVVYLEERLEALGLGHVKLLLE